METLSLPEILDVGTPDIENQGFVSRQSFSRVFASGKPAVPMNITHFTNTYLPHVGGVARSVSTFVEAQERSGHTVKVIAPEYKLPKDYQPIPNVTRMPAIQNFNGSDFALPLPATAKVRASLDAFQPQILHAHHPFLLGDTAYREAEKRDIPIVFTHHTRYEDYTHYVPIDNSVFKRFIIELSTEFANLCDGVVAPSQTIADLIRERGVTAPIAAIPTGIDLERFKGGSGQKFREELNIDPHAPVLGHLGRLAEEKNIEFLARAIGYALFANKQAHCVVAGSGKQAYMLERYAEEAGCRNRLHLVGVLQGDALAECYAAMDVFVFSSLSETQGLVLAEAMAAETAVVALKAAGANECVVDGENGFLLDTDSVPGDFAAKVLSILETPDRCRKMQAAALHKAREFDKTLCNQKLIDFYKQTMERFADVQRDENAQQPMEHLLKRIQAEWKLVSMKIEAMSDALHSD